MELKQPYFLFLGDVQDQLAAKVAHGLVEWRRDWCVGQLRLPGCQADTGMPDLTIREAADRGARTFVVAVANAGGFIAPSWVPTILEAIEAGFDVASGLHTRLSSVPEIAARAAERGVALHDVRHAERTFGTGKGTIRSGRRLLTVGTDCSVGKKYTALALEQEMRRRGMDADFRATGQTGVLISGRGVAIDAVVADFISGAVEWLSPAADEDHWDLVEGQGSLFHPSFSGVSLGLLHGAQPDAFVVCHEPTRRTMRGVQTPVPSIADVVDMTLRLGRLVNPAIRCCGIAVNTEKLDDAAARAYLRRTAQEHALPATDPIRFGVGPIVDRLADLSI
ncbi:N-acetyltransferase DgcN [Chthonobacter rhizosphaerae]|uniref:N-acetyltransferase DgcN n=1 Tax=Chthonobacter rhizosphaerae TaxID=2735553 RepID=UPI0015EFB38F|nr:N-acetyltransferase DgcN [Chthonobacter rhizosphaerae]